MLQITENDYASYYKPYIELLTDDDILNQLEDQKDDFLDFLQRIPEPKWGYAYQKDKWTIKEVLGHLLDSEIIFGYRALCLIRDEKENLLGYQENDYVKSGKFGQQSSQMLVNLWLKAREMNLMMFQSFSPIDWENKGLADGKNICAKCVPFILAGHLKHHMDVIKERYLVRKKD